MIGILRLPLGPCSYSWYLPVHRRVLSGCLPRCVCNWHFQKPRVPKFTASSLPRAAMPRPRTERGAASPATGMAPAARPWAVGAATVRAAAAGGAKADEACGARPGASDSGACGYRPGRNGPVCIQVEAARRLRPGPVGHDQAPRSWQPHQSCLDRPVGLWACQAKSYPGRGKVRGVHFCP
jgi:hypothetical protein